MPSSLIRGKYVICRAGNDADTTTVISDGAVSQRDGEIVDVGPYEQLRTTADVDEVIGGPKYVVFPGLVNTHHHGRGVSTFQMVGVEGCLETNIISGLGRRPFDHYLMTLYSSMRMIESGTTSVMYNHTQTPVSGLEEEVADVLRGFRNVGMRTAFSVWFREQNQVVYADDEQFLSGLPSDLASGLRKTLAATNVSKADYFKLFEKTYNEYGSDPNGLFTVLLSPANTQWVSDDFLQTVKEYANKFQTGVHMHLTESIYQKEYGIRTWSKTPAAHLDELGFLGPELSCAHGVWLTEGDIELLAGNHATVCHNPSSNLRHKNGVAPVNTMLAKGLNVSMGTDSGAINDDDDLIQEMRLASKLHRQPSIAAPAVTSHQVLKMATLNAAQPTFFHDRIGSLEKGKRADMVLMDLTAIEEPYLDSRIDVVDALLYRGKARQVDTVLIDGEVVLRDGQFTNVDKQDVLQELKDWFSRPVEASTLEAQQMAQRLIPYVERFYREWDPGESTPHYMYNSRR